MIGVERPMGRDNRRFASTFLSVLTFVWTVLVLWLVPGFWQAVGLLAAFGVLASFTLFVGYDMGYKTAEAAGGER